MSFPIEIGIFQCHVSFQGSTWNFVYHWRVVQPHTGINRAPYQSSVWGKVEILKKSWTANASTLQKTSLAKEISQNISELLSSKTLFIYLSIYLFIDVFIHYLFRFFRGRGVSGLSFNLWSRKLCFLVSFAVGLPLLALSRGWIEVHYLSSYNNAFRTMDSKCLQHANFPRSPDETFHHGTPERVSRYSQHWKKRWSLLSFDNPAGAGDLDVDGQYQPNVLSFVERGASWLVNIYPPTYLPRK